MKGKAIRKKTRHHVVNKSRGGTKHPSNILMIYRDKHDIWHKLFGDLTLKEAACLLLRIDRMKGVDSYQ